MLLRGAGMMLRNDTARGGAQSLVAKSVKRTSSTVLIMSSTSLPFPKSSNIKYKATNRGCVFVCVCAPCSQWKCPIASAAFTLTTGSGSWSSITRPDRKQEVQVERKRHENRKCESKQGSKHVLHNVCPVSRPTFGHAAHVKVREELLG